MNESSFFFIVMAYFFLGSYDNCTKGKAFVSASLPAFAASASSSKSSSLTAKNPRSVGEVPTFHPTREQLQDFTSYLSDCSRNSKDYGMCRIIPPEGWKVVNRTFGLWFKSDFTLI